MFLLLRKGQFGEKLEKKVEIFLIPVLKPLQVQKAISYHFVYNHTIEKAEPLKSAGAGIAKNANDAIRSSECVILMLADAKAIHDVLLRAVSRPELAGRTVIQMGTISPVESMALNRDVLEAGGDYFEAPVLGSIPEVREGRLIVMVGASPAQFDRWSEFLKCFGPNPLLIGQVGKASALKLAMNQLIASLTVTFSLSLAFVLRKGINVQLFMKILRESALYAPTFDKKLERMMERDYSNPNFSTKHLAKDIDLFLDEAKSMSLETTSLDGIRRLLEITLDKGFIETDYSALFNTINPEE